MLEKELPQKHEDLDFILPSPILQRAVGGCCTFIAVGVGKEIKSLTIR